MDYSTSAAAAIFPSSHDAGQCAVQLVSVLIEAHNRLLRYKLMYRHTETTDKTLRISCVISRHC